MKNVVGVGAPIVGPWKAEIDLKATTGVPNLGTETEETLTQEDGIITGVKEAGVEVLGTVTGIDTEAEVRSTGMIGSGTGPGKGSTRNLGK